MTEVRLHLTSPGSAEGWYCVKAKGCMLAVLYWGDERGPFSDWSPISYVPVDPAGNGAFYFPNNRAVPGLATHVWTKVYARDFVLCHAPMIRHNPSRNDGPAYLDGNKRIQEILDRTGRVIFLSGHTHVSPNGLSGNAEYDCAHDNIYLDCASVVATDTSGEHGLMHHDWKDGCVTELSISGTHVLIHMRSIDAGVNFSRGCYRFKGIEA